MKKFSIVDDCPVDTTINVIKGKCKAAIILKIYEGFNRFGLLKKEVSISTKILAVQLNELEEDGIVIKEKSANNPLQTFYYLSADGRNLCDIIQQMKEWGNGYKLFSQIKTYIWQ
jgi:DNA-binding HxlR family transcriptional regulator